MDSAAPELARGALRDLVRINRFLGGHIVLRSMLSRLVHRDEEFSVLDVGAASGDMAAQIRRRYPRATVVCLDQRPIHLDAASGLRVAGDAFRLPFGERSFDFVFSSLFLHHFEDPHVVELLQSFRRVARRAVLAIDLERHPLAYYFIPSTKMVLGWDPITVNDAPVSVESGFHRGELLRLAHAAGLTEAAVTRHHPWFRLALVAPTT
ncbi:MAG: methyltransferase domain-containing protein [Bryobacteraceae bacterium]